MNNVQPVKTVMKTMEATWGKEASDLIRVKKKNQTQCDKCAPYSKHMDRKTRKEYIKMIKVVLAVG